VDSDVASRLVALSQRRRPMPPGCQPHHSVYLRPSQSPSQPTASRKKQIEMCDMLNPGRGQAFCLRLVA
jgi:hypothetical protein